MKKKTVVLLLSVALIGTMFAGCAKNKATVDANESEKTEKEGTGEEDEDASVTPTPEEKSDDAKSADTEDESGNDSSDESYDSVDTEDEAKEKIAILLPNEENWSMDAEELSAKFTNDGYEAEILYANDDSSRQFEQVQDATEKQVSAMVIAPVDEYGLSDVLADVKEASIPVFSYDDLIMDTNAVNYYVTFGGRQVGNMIAQGIVDSMELDKVREAKESRTIEFLMGSLDDTQALFLYNGVMEILQPYFDDGTLTCPSGRTSFEDTGILRWSEDTAKTRISDIMNSYYKDGEAPDILCTGFDEAALGAVEALEELGMSSELDNWPMITGSGCTANGVRSVAEDKISFSIFMDRRTLADQCEEMVNVYLHGDDDPEVNDYEQYDNGIKIIATYLCEPQLINDENYEILIDNGYYDEDEVRPEATPTPTEEPVTVTPEETEATPTEEITPTPTTKAKNG